MSLREKIEKANLTIPKENILYNEPMKKYTSFKIGGPAECLVKINKIEELKELIEFTNKNNIPFHIIGNGSNLLVLDKGIDGITGIIKIQKIDIQKADTQQGKIKVVVGAGEKMAKVAHLLAQEEITGLEELAGIPGTIGGAIVMNAGAHGKEMKDVVKSVKCIDCNGNEKIFTNEEMEFEYRKSRIKRLHEIVLEVEMELQKGTKEEIEQKMRTYTEYRKEKQPINYPSAGSTFKRGNDFITAKLIDDAGLKGYTIGGAMVSTKHSGFVINKGNATAKDVLELIKHVKEEVYKKFNKNIELEIEVMGK